MANYCVLFSSVLTVETDEQLAWLKEHIEANKADLDENDNYDSPCDFDYKIETEKSGGSVWFHTEESGEPSHVADLVQAFLRHFKLNSTWQMEWSNSCDKARLDAYGGGAVVVTATKQRWMSTSRWVDQTAERLSKVKARNKRKK